MVIELPTVRQGGKRYPRAHVRRDSGQLSTHAWAVTVELRPGSFVCTAGTNDPWTQGRTTWPAAMRAAHRSIHQLRRYQETPGAGDPL